MPLYIRDDAVAQLAVRLMHMTGAENKTEAVRRALLAQIEAVQNRKPLLERIEEIRAEADTIGAVDPGFDMKAFTDQMWGDA
ncbi:MAG: type II toxin-antitoxin system VapB family antitoxin [Albidovulum sp.]|uniref:type II toxin-antitoxin system VapB family antitoxin n=1 Tax=Albidovulum sp. TaxID=1872424 RepID=UPI003C99DF2F